MSEQHQALIALDGKLRRARLELAIEALAPFAPQLAATTLPDNLSQYPLEEWLEQTELLISAGVHERYAQHSRQHARSLAELLAGPAAIETHDIARIEQRVAKFFGADTPEDEALDLGAGLRLRKKRRDDNDCVEDWSAIDALVTMRDEEVRALRGDHPYLEAICAYRLGDYEDCRNALRRCLDDDKDVEEYWMLLAFTERHLGRFDVFERIVFQRQRE